MIRKYCVGESILEWATSYPDSPAMSVGGESWSYADLVGAAGGLAETLPQPNRDDELPVTAILVDRRCGAYLGILASVLRGNTYVPINVGHPVCHNVEVLRRSGASTLIVGAHQENYLSKMLDAGPEFAGSLSIVHCGASKSEFAAVEPGRLTAYSPNDEHLAYILFTSGSTGTPKGVPISYKNLRSYLEAAASIIKPVHAERFSQTFELTFDLSVHDLFICLTHGAELVVADSGQLQRPADFIRENSINCWFSVPSLTYQMSVSGDLRDGIFPDLRWSMFCGEALPVDIATRWMAAAPNSRVENWYGPTEATIACTRFEVTGDSLNEVGKGGLVPIGKPFDNMEMLIVGENLQEAELGKPGELLLTGTQLASGYLNDVEKSATSFIHLPDRDGVFYRTGDLVVRREDGNIVFLNRIDNQVKIRGFRVELGAIETTFRHYCSEAVNVVALSWPPDQPSGRTVILAVEGMQFEIQSIVDEMKAELPEYMLPSRVEFMKSLPKNVSGKVDRRALSQQLRKVFADKRNQSLLEKLPHAQAKLMQIVLDTAPDIDIDRVMKADSLIAAGMDSLGFVILTAEIEKRYALELQQEVVALMAEMPFTALAKFLLDKESGVESRAVIPKQVTASSASRSFNRRANRALQFIERFPQSLKAGDKSPVFAVGSSGIFRCFSTEVFDRVAAEYGNNVASFNIGLPAVSMQGLARVCEYIQSVCEQRGLRAPLIIYELDPMLISVSPPSGDIGLSDEHFCGEFKHLIDDKLSQEFSWTVDARGSGSFNRARSVPRVTPPDWQQRRAGEVAQTFLGNVDFRQDSINAWLRGARALSAVGKEMRGFIHPVDASIMATVLTPHGDKLDKILKVLGDASNIPIIDWQSFVLEHEDFLDFNHVNARSGMDKLTEQLARRIYSESYSPTKVAL